MNDGQRPTTCCRVKALTTFNRNWASLPARGVDITCGNLGFAANNSKADSGKSSRLCVPSETSTLTRGNQEERCEMCLKHYVGIPSKCQSSFIPFIYTRQLRTSRRDSALLVTPHQRPRCLDPGSSTAQCFKPHHITLNRLRRLSQLSKPRAHIQRLRWDHVA